MALWGVLSVANKLQLTYIHIYGNSNLIIECIIGRQHLYTPELQGWYTRAQSLWDSMGNPPMTHIYRDNNTRADGLSKRGLREAFGLMQMEHYRDRNIIRKTTDTILI